jgi:hypothetical protein
LQHVSTSYRRRLQLSGHVHDVGLKVEGALPKFTTVGKNDNEDDV